MSLPSGSPRRQTWLTNGSPACVFFIRVQQLHRPWRQIAAPVTGCSLSSPHLGSNNHLNAAVSLRGKALLQQPNSLSHRFATAQGLISLDSWGIPCSRVRRRGMRWDEGSHLHQFDYFVLPVRTLVDAEDLREGLLFVCASCFAARSAFLAQKRIAASSENTSSGA